MHLAIEQQSADDRGKLRPRLRKPSHRNVKAPLVETFLKGALSGGAVSVAELEVKARAAGLLGEHQQIGDAKKFRGAKKRLGITSRRDGFGRGGGWLWELPIQTSVANAETALDLASVQPAGVFYEGTQSRPHQEASTEPLRSDPNSARNDGVPPHGVPLDWIRGVACLRQQRRPSGIPEHRWRLFVADCVRFIDPHYPWAQRAAEVGWATGSLFGSRYQRPIDHIGSSGLLWDLAGGTIMQVSRDTVTIVSANGKERIFHRRPAWMTTVLPWDWS
jgi:hypothetical protein